LLVFIDESVCFPLVQTSLSIPDFQLVFWIFSRENLDKKKKNSSSNKQESKFEKEKRKEKREEPRQMI